MSMHPADPLTAQAVAALARAGHELEPAAVSRAVRRWWASSRPNRVPLGYALGHFLPLGHDTTAALDVLGAEAADGGGARV